MMLLLYQPGKSAVHAMIMAAMENYARGYGRVSAHAGLGVLAKILSEREPGVLFVQAAGLQNLLVLPIAKVRGYRIIYYLHEPSSFREKIANGNPVFKSIIWHLVQLFDAQMSAQILVSREVLAEQTRNAYGVELAKIRIAPLIMNAPDAVSISGPRRRLTYIGRIDDRRYFSEFLESASEMAAAGFIPTILTGDVGKLDKYRIPSSVDCYAVEKFSEDLKAKILSETHTIWNPKSIEIAQSGVTIEALRFGTFIILTKADPEFESLTEMGVAVAYQDRGSLDFAGILKRAPSDILDVARQTFEDRNGTNAYRRTYVDLFGTTKSGDGAVGSSPQTEVQSDAKKLIYVGGWGRSGSTILGNVLGSRPSCISVGEARYIWDRGLIYNNICGCGQRFSECEFWSQIVDLDSVANIGGAEVMMKSVGSRAPKLVISKKYKPVDVKRARSTATTSADILRNLYKGAYLVSGASVIVDTSKSPSYFAKLMDLHLCDGYFVHLVRDPVSVAESWSSKKRTQDADNVELFPIYSPIRSALQWSLYNFLSWRVGVQTDSRYLQVSYERFLAYPSVVVREILDFTGQSIAGVDTVQYEFDVLVQHSISGNPSRFQTGIVKISEKIVRRLGFFDKLLVRVITMPVRVMIGYRG